MSELENLNANDLLRNSPLWYLIGDTYKWREKLKSFGWLWSAQPGGGGRWEIYADADDDCLKIIESMPGITAYREVLV